ncbi:Mysoin-binding motif of peroxisomes-domain-containing protein [Sphaerosporella brunnea]|uniref:Vezatin n=1 Tax=Sphaerosporella brunnea TaxID=1250544 RepID=A0A5J5EWI4_9PEZI|nr:Mysoin-binding motif of peroxisomes-domain-containing protein [Sphaerosporella brunnea]
MESIVFANSPLAEYLEGNGEQADWGIEPPVESSSDESDAPCFAPSGNVRSRGNYKGLRPLRMSQYGSGRCARFFELFSKTVDTRLSHSENSRFLERFRYIIIASQLLNGHVNVSHYDRSQGQNFSEDDHKTAIFGNPYTKVRYWVQSGGFLLASTLVLSWVFRGNGDGIFSKGRAVIAVIIIVIVGIALFTRARRKWLRSLRLKAVEFAAVFIENSQTFDILASNAVTLIQEVELVSRGYRLSLPLPPVTRLESGDRTRRCARLRKSVLSALTMAIPPHNRACISLRHLVQEADLEKFYDIYDLQLADLQEAELGVEPGDELGDLESLKALKTLLHRLHTTRRVFLCSLLAIDADGGYSDYTRWGLAVEQLRSLGNLIAELAGELKKILAEQDQFSIPPTPVATAPLSPEGEKCRGQLRKLNSLSQALRGLQAKMHVLREESDRTLQESSDLSDFGRDLLSHYDSIGADLRGLVDEWENARACLAMSVERQSPRNSGSPDSIDGSTLVGDTPRNSGLFTKDGPGGWADAAGLGLFSQPEESEQEQDPDTEVVFEAVAESKPIRPRSFMTRDERIKKVREERIKAEEHRKSLEAGLALQKELQSVLVNRPAPKRRYTTRAFSR